ncbi:Bor family protein [Tenacibaculum maritimum]|uniref:Bor family protein n=1 Tax=Tenacibaculum maritimum TaxID=107401 RepID=UPI0012E60B13|nr:Bor family protein [Tenacibaculum maritimum]MDB0600635.1 Bor family protein [Tenacibaculum maritimum]MDB0612305.1 Bor family protein [Tenacibaculum maritimum]CAA0186825.1 conserved exported hypothetical protein [Tenacibaculum maritimum]CAA0221652.1 conserved exported hypothetical protein [Tenacibaculum maritimum]
MKKITLILAVTFCLTSCYSHKYSVGTGAKSGVTVTKKNHYLINGLAPLSVSNPKEMAKGSENYDVHTSHSFVDTLLGAITMGIYTPTTTKVTK